MTGDVDPRFIDDFLMVRSVTASAVNVANTDGVEQHLLVEFTGKDGVGEIESVAVVLRKDIAEGVWKNLGESLKAWGAW